MKKSTFLLAALMCGAWCATAQTTENGHEYVDLDLPSGLKWATCNVGATTPEGYGNYYAWGETEPKGSYDWGTYKWATATYDAENEWWDLETLTKYNIGSVAGTVDNKTVLELADDAARAHWGGVWRMPTDEEWTELRDKCTWTWKTLNGVNGYEVKGTNGNSIFLPAAGCRYFDNLDAAGNEGYYWSSSLNTDDPYLAWDVYFGSDYVSRSDFNRFCGQSVRPVVDKSGSTTALQPATTAVNIYTQNGRIVCEGDFRIYDLLGRDVTRLNGSLCGVYVVTVGDAAQKVVVK